MATDPESIRRIVVVSNIETTMETPAIALESNKECLDGLREKFPNAEIVYQYTTNSSVCFDSLGRYCALNINTRPDRVIRPSNIGLNIRAC